MRVWVIKNGEYLPIQAGARPMRTWLLARELARRGHEVTWWHSSFSHQTRERLVEKDCFLPTDEGFELGLVDVGTYKHNYSLARLRHHQKLATRWLEIAPTRPAPDLIICAYPPIELAEAAAGFAKRIGARFVVDARDYWPDTFSDRAPWPFGPLVDIAVGGLRRSARRTFEAADALVAMSGEMLAWALRYRATGKVVPTLVVPIGSQDVGRPSDERPKADDAPLTVFFGGSFATVYAIETVVDAAAVLAARGRHDIRFIIAGSGSRAAALRTRAKSLPNVSFPGWLAAEEYRRALLSADIGVLPYSAPKYAAFPNKVFEYFAAGLPVVSSTPGEVKIILAEHQAGAYFDHDDAAALADILAGYADDRARARAEGANGRRLFETRYRSDICYPAYVDFVEKLVSTPSA